MHWEEFPTCDFRVTEALLCAGASHTLFPEVDAIVPVLYVK